MHLVLAVASAVAADISEEVTIGPNYRLDPAAIDHGRSNGTWINFTMPLNHSHSVFNGSDPQLDRSKPGYVNRDRSVLVHIPSSYVDGTPAALLVLQDGLQFQDRMRLIANAQANLAASVSGGRTLPGFIMVGIQNGGFGSDGLGTERNLEYDTLSERYTQFVENEVLPAVERHPRVLARYRRLHFTSDPWGRGVLGCSSGGSAALTMGWFRPDLFRRIAAFSISNTPLQIPGLPETITYPGGAWDYHSGLRLLERGDKRPLRVLVHNSEHDLGWHGNCSAGDVDLHQKLGCWNVSDGNPPGSFRDGRHNWVVAGNRTAAALRAKGYEYRHVYALNATHCGMFDSPHRNLWTDALIESLVWLWQGYKG